MIRTRTTEGAGRITQVKLPEPMKAAPGWVRCYQTESGCSVICGHEPARANPTGLALPESALRLWHLSLAHPERYPTWDEIADVRYKLIPDDVTMALLLPPPDEYLNVHEFCLHCWEIDDIRDPKCRP